MNQGVLEERQNIDGQEFNPNQSSSHLGIGSWNSTLKTPFDPDIFQVQMSLLNSNETKTRERDEDLAKIEMAVLSCIFIVTLMGNFIVILGIYFRRQKMSRMYYFILHLSLADLITAFFNVGAQFAMELTFPEFFGNNVLCKFVKFTQILGPYSSSYVLVMTALDRYQVICYPLSNCTWTPKRSKVMLGIAWAISFFFCTPQLFIFSLQEVMGHDDCWASFPSGAQEVYVTWYAISFFIIPLLILIFAYTCICRTIWMNFNLKTAATRQDYQGLHHGNQVVLGNHGNQVVLGNHGNQVVLGNHGNQVVLGNHGNQVTESLQNDTQAGNDDVTNDTSAFPSNKTQMGILGRNRLNSNKAAARRQVDVSWHLDKKGNVNTIKGNSTGEKGEWRDQSLSSSSTDQTPCSDNSSSEVQIIQNGRHGSSVKFHHNASKMNDFKSKCEIQYKWASAEKKEKVGIIGQNEINGRIHSNTVESKPVSRRSMRQLIPLGKNEKTPGRRITSQQGGRKKPSIKQTLDSQPRSSSVKGISRAKIKTVKLTVTVICCYIICSSPFITAQLWVTFDPNAYQSKFYTGTTFTILTLLASLNSCVNPWIFLFFNPNLLQDFLRGIGCMQKVPIGKFRRTSGGSPVTQKTSPGLLRSAASSFNSTKANHHVNSRHVIPRHPTPSAANSITMPSPFLLAHRLLSPANSNSVGRERHDVIVNMPSSSTKELNI